jgi:predicted outer membrane repeat protein
MKGRRRAIAAIWGAGLIALASVAPAAALPSPVCSPTDSAGLKTDLGNIGCLTINLAPTTYTVPSGDSSFNVNHTVTIAGPDRANTILTSGTTGGIVTVTSPSALILSGVTIRDATGGSGLTVLAPSASASLSNVAITGNHLGGISTNSNGALTVTDSVISGNSSTVDGGGIFAGGAGPVTLDRVELSGNSTAVGGEHDGGAIADEGPGALSLTNVTVSGNSTTHSGGGIYQNISSTSAVTLNNVTIAGNTADSNMTGANGGDGGGLFTSSAHGVSIRNSILAGNTDTGGDANDCSSSPGHEVTRQGYELIGESLSCTFAMGDSSIGFLTGSPGLGPLAPNGGTSQTMALLPGSQALEAGNPLTPGSGGIACAATDQRGQPRGGAAGTCDIGAFEAQPPPPTTVPPSPAPTTPTIPRKKCKKHQKLKHGRCVKKRKK